MRPASILYAVTCLLLLPDLAALRRQNSTQASKAPPAGDSFSLLQRSTAATARASAGRSKHKAPLSPQFFGGFNQAESTYDEAYFDKAMDNVMDWDTFTTGNMGRTVDKKFFAESPSAGKTDAWQTFYPPVGDVILDGYYHGQEWKYVDGEYMQPYSDSKLGYHGSDGGNVKAPDWFDSNVIKYNGMGQPQQPQPGTGPRLLEAMPGQEWVQRAVNVTVACKEVGCTAKSLLQVFDPDSEEAQLCRLNIDVHPTDYDNEWSKEFVKYWKVNDHLATVRCNPHAMGCNATASRPLIPCLQDLGVDHLLAGNGTLVIEGSINKMVDECPYEGNLLSAVAMVTCMARKKVVLEPRAAADASVGGASFAARAGIFNGTNGSGSGSGSGDGANGGKGGASANGAYGGMELSDDMLLPGSRVLSNASLLCRTPGCAAQTKLFMDPAIIRAGATCLMNVSVVQTDFDESVEGNTEQIEFISLEGVGNISTNVTPGRNPCTELYSTGVPVAAKDRVFAVITNLNVSAEILAPPIGELILSGKVSPQVDECASPAGFLFDGLVTVECKIPVPEGYVAPSTTTTAAAAETPKSAIMDFNIGPPVTGLRERIGVR